MKPTDRRHLKNAHLRQQIDEIQHASELLQRLTQEIQSQTIASARSGQLANLPNVELSKQLSISMRNQRAALKKMQDALVGRKEIDAANLISKDELAALLK